MNKRYDLIMKVILLLLIVPFVSSRVPAKFDLEFVRFLEPMHAPQTRTIHCENEQCHTKLYDPQTNLIICEGVFNLDTKEIEEVVSSFKKKVAADHAQPIIQIKYSEGREKLVYSVGVRSLTSYMPAVKFEGRAAKVCYPLDVSKR